MGIRKGDTVMVMTGKDKGKTGKVLSLNAITDRVVVEHVNTVKRHTKPTQSSPKGGIVEKEAAVHLSNVMFYDEKAAQPTRLGVERSKDGKKIRISRKTGKAVD